MLSRVAENIYWLARYVERAENTARMVNVTANLLLDLPRGTTLGWEPLVAITGSDEIYRKRHTDYAEAAVLMFLIGDLGHPGSILSSLRGARENCRTIRDIVPREAWEHLNELYFAAGNDLQTGLTKRGRHPYLKRIVLGSQALTGLLAGAMNQDQGYQFLRIGRNLERADMTSRIVDVRSADLVNDESLGPRPFENIQWMSVLKSLTGYQMYRRSQQVRIRRPEVLRFLFRSEEFPRAISHCISAVEAGVTPLPRNEAALRALGRIKRLLLGTEVESLGQAALHDYIDQLQCEFAELHEEISRTWFLR